jgi:hypothetical protein
MASKYVQTSLAAVLLIAAALPLMARDSAGGERVATVSLALSHDAADWRLEDAGSTVDTRYSRAALELWSQDIPVIDLGLTAGVGRLSQDGDPVAEGRAFTGESLGLLARTQWSLTEHLGLRLRAEGIYHRLDDDDIDLEWFDAYARLGLRAELGYWRLGAGSTAGFLNGERRRPGETEDFELDDHAGAYARAAIATGRDGEVSLSAELGPRQAVSLRFTRDF